MHRVTKSIDFCYGHRLLDYDGKCRNLHGHNGRLEVDVEASELDGRGMVIDFADVREVVKGWIDANLDHKMLLCRRDPVAAILQDLNEPIYLMEDNPTAENISRLVFNQTRKQGINVTEVRLWETHDGFATYRES